MKKKFEKIGKPLDRSAQKNVAGGKTWECANNGVQIWPYDPMGPKLGCCSGFYDGSGYCRAIGDGGHPCPPPNQHLMCYGAD